MSVSNDLMAVLRGLNKVRVASWSLQQQACRRMWKNSTIRSSVQGVSNNNNVINFKENCEKLCEGLKKMVPDNFTERRPTSNADLHVTSDHSTINMSNSPNKNPSSSMSYDDKSNYEYVDKEEQGNFGFQSNESRDYNFHRNTSNYSSVVKPGDTVKDNLKGMEADKSLANDIMTTGKPTKSDEFSSHKEIYSKLLFVEGEQVIGRENNNISHGSDNTTSTGTENNTMPSDYYSSINDTGVSTISSAQVCTECTINTVNIPGNQVNSMAFDTILVKHSNQFNDKTETQDDAIGQRKTVEQDIKVAESEAPPNFTLSKGNKTFGEKSGKQENESVGKRVTNTLSAQSRERRVPGSRLGRLVSFGNLAAGLGAGAVAEVTRRTLGISKQQFDGNSILGTNPFLSEANAQRIVDTLCRVRGAALKLGQMLSIQDSTLISPQLQQIFERVRQNADFMPAKQMERVMENELKSDWMSKFVNFDMRPFAAASIGQVHCGTLQDGRQVAVKIQYPGVAESIDSDIDNLMAILKVWNILPEGLYAENTLKVARHELAWECDYTREAQCSQHFRKLLANDEVFYVPNVISELTTKKVLTAELVSGLHLDKLKDHDQTTRNYICHNLLRLCLEELFVYNFMQTDPNWSNFMYDSDTKRISLLDFGASRFYDLKFVHRYLQVIRSAADGDRDGVKENSIKLGMLTGYENKAMIKAHVDAVMILGEPFSSDEPFNFASQTTASRVHHQIPIMLKYRLTPPPEETYSLHRKMAGCFLLCAKLKAIINCKQIFENIWTQYKSNTKQ